MNIKFTNHMKKELSPVAVMLLCSCAAFHAASFYVPEPVNAEPAGEAVLSEEIPALPKIEPLKLEAETEATKESVPDETAPVPYRLNFAYRIDEQSGESYAEILLKELIQKDSKWYSELYDMAAAAPASLAARYGRSRSQVLGQYNPASEDHQQNDPDTWTVDHFKNVTVSFYNGDGTITSAISNAQQILSMASVYCYYNDIQELDQIRSYVNRLWVMSHSYSVSIGDVYYCAGCMDPYHLPAKGSSDSELEGEDHFNGESSINTEINAPIMTENEAPGFGDQGNSESGQEAETSVSVLPEGAVIREDGIVIVPTTPGYSGTTVAVESTTSALQSLAETAESIFIEESRPSIVIIRGNEPSSSNADTQADAESIEESTDTAAEEASDLSVPDSTAKEAGDPSVTDTDSEGGIVIVRPDQESGGASSDTEELEYHVQSASFSQNGQTGTELICPGHIDLKITAKIFGLEDQNGLFAVDPVGNQTVEGSSWDGWTERNRAFVTHMERQDWAETYGITVTMAETKAPLSTAEIDSYMSFLPEDTSEMRKEIIRFALQSVGKVPYYWGGKPSARNYSGNQFGSVTVPDHKGRILKGLDCSGWISWVYWSVTGERLAYEGTEGLKSMGSQVERKDLKPGDIVVITGSTPHVIMFLGWTENGQIRCIHETGSVNNVTVGVMNAQWPYYRNLLD